MFSEQLNEQSARHLEQLAGTLQFPDHHLSAKIDITNHPQLTETLEAHFTPTSNEGYINVLTQGRSLNRTVDVYDIHQLTRILTHADGMDPLARESLRRAALSELRKMQSLLDEARSGLEGLQVELPTEAEDQI